MERRSARISRLRPSASHRRTTDIKITIRRGVPAIPFDAITRHVLSASYELSLVICGDALARRINRAHRGKTYAANVLSFPLAVDEGELFLNIRAAEREARRYGVSVRGRLALLYVHGLFHLKGLKHGARMERQEQRVLRAFKVES